MDVKAIIIIPSPNPNPGERFIERGLEWTKGWKLKLKENKIYEIAYKLDDEEKINYIDTVSEFDPSVMGDKKIIIWLNLADLDYKPDQIQKRINDLVEKLQNIEYRIAYHSDLEPHIPQNLKGKAKSYTLAKSNERQFQAIIKKENNGTKYLDALAKFKDIFQCFFLTIEDISVIKHKIMNLFIDLEIDYQTLKSVEENKKGKIWEEISNKKLQERWDRIENVLKDRVENEVIRNEIIQQLNSLINSLKETDLYKALDESKGINAFKVKENKSFSQWYQELDKCLDKIREQLT